MSELSLLMHVPYLFVVSVRSVQHSMHSVYASTKESLITIDDSRNMESMHYRCEECTCKLTFQSVGKGLSDAASDCHL